MRTRHVVEGRGGVVGGTAKGTSSAPSRVVARVLRVRVLTRALLVTPCPDRFKGRQPGQKD